MTIIEAPVGPIRAHHRGNILEALGIPYARAARFGYPQPVQARDFGEPYEANQPAPAAPQHLREGATDIRQSPHMSEDCQNLSVLAPADLQAGEKLPVMVYIHGGSYVVGSGDGARYTPDALIEEHRVLLVRLTYRLGILGFLGGKEGRPANLGLLDAREGLRWVKTNIASFGGDPNNITLFGQSAGGDLIARLMVSEGVVEEGLVHRAIIQSAPLELIRGKQKMVDHMHLVIAQKLSSDATAQDYGKLSYSMQMQSPLRFGIYRALMAFGTQAGHYPLPPEDQLDQALTAVAGKVDILIGSNARESAYFLPRAAKPWALRLLEPGVRHFTQHMYTKPAQRFTNLYRAAGGTITRYQLTTGQRPHTLASAHCTELGLLFDNPAWQGSSLYAGSSRPQQEEQGKALRAIWATFAHTGTIRRDLATPARLTLH